MERHHGHVDVAVPRKKDDGQAEAALVHDGLRLDARQSGHAHVHHDAAPHRWRVPSEKVVRRPIVDHAPALGLEHEAKRVAKRSVVIHNAHEHSLLHPRELRGRERSDLSSCHACVSRPQEAFSSLLSRTALSPVAKGSSSKGDGSPETSLTGTVTRATSPP